MKEEKTRGVTCYKSTLLNKIFDNYEDLVKAEEEYEKVNAERLKLAEEKKARAKEVEEAFKQLELVKEKAYKEISEAETKAYELRNKFVKDYGSFHYSYSNDNGKKTITFGDLMGLSVIDEFFR